MAGDKCTVEFFPMLLCGQLHETGTTLIKIILGQLCLKFSFKNTTGEIL